MKFVEWLLLNFPISFMLIGQGIMCIYELMWIGRALLKKNVSNYIIGVSYAGMFYAVICRVGIMTWILYYSSLIAFWIFLNRQKFNHKAYRIFITIFGICLIIWFPFSF